MTAPSSSPTDDLDDEGMRKVRSLVLGLLYESRTFARMATWPRAVVRIRPEGNDVVHRAQFANELLDADMREQAHECLHRRVAPGEVLCHVLADTETEAVAAFVVLPLARRPR